YSVKVFVDTVGIVPELDYTNNILFRNFTVYPRTNVSIECELRLLSVEAEGSLAYRIVINNTGELADRFNLTVEKLPSGWVYSFIQNNTDIKTVLLNPGEEVQITLKIRTAATPTGDIVFSVVVSSQSDLRVKRYLELTARVTPKPSLLQWLWLIPLVVSAILLATAITIAIRKRAIPKKVKFEVGLNYLIKEEVPTVCFKLFKNATKTLPGLCLTTTFPAKVREKHGLKVPVFWLSETETKEEKRLDPRRLEFEIMEVISDFARDKGKCIVLIEGYELLVIANGIERTVKFIKKICDIISKVGGSLIVSINPLALSKENVSVTEKEFDVVV
ncbi:MAG: DUF835 domain-containing protein, partial [Candidatus Thermoplasmatota archaeon]